MPRSLHRAPARWARRLVRTVEVTVLVAVLGGASVVAAHFAASPGARPRPPAVVHRPRVASAGGGDRVVVASVSPAPGSTDVSPTAAVTVRFASPRPASAPLPTLDPPEVGGWRRLGREELRFQPFEPVLPQVRQTLRLAEGGSTPAVIDHWQVRSASVLRLQEVLATLGYLPLTWTPAAGVPTAPAGSAAELAALYEPPQGVFDWRYPNTPTSLQAAWAVGVDNHMTTGAMVSFEVHDGLPGYTSIRPQLWPRLLAAEAAGVKNPVGYTYALVSQALPETLTLWHDGIDVLDSDVNTGVNATPTPVGTYFVYRRFASTTMSGTNPNGTYYLDHGVKWVNYFDGGVAIHGFVRSSYGFPQSLGCVELPLADAQAAWGWIHYGTVVTVLPEPSATAAASAPS